jgi:antitoxin component of MazEF toxin-antitoxin module
MNLPRDPLTFSIDKHGAVLLRPARRKYGLEELVSGITHKNLHGQTDWGQPVGKEPW